MNKLAIFLILVTAHIALAGQESVRFPEGPASWTVKIQPRSKAQSSQSQSQSQSPGATPAAAMTIQRIEVTQTETARRSVIFWADGRTSQLWSLPNSTVCVTEDRKGQAVTTRGAWRYGDSFGAGDFAWVQPSSLIGDKPVQYGGTPCYHYKGALSLPQVQDQAPMTIACEAWIDAKTLLPVALQKGDQFGTFTFGNPPTTPLDMPEKFRSSLEQYKRLIGI